MTTVVTVTYDSARTLERCLESTRGLRHVVVDNASRDASADIAEQFPHVEVLRNPRNVGFAAAANLGMRIAAPEDVFLLNPDAYIESDTLAQLEAALRRHPRAALVAPRLRYLDGTVQPSARTFPSPLTMLLRRSILGRIGGGQARLSAHLAPSHSIAEVELVDWVIGAAMVVRRVAIEAVGTFDPRFFLYAEDVDFCYRLWAAKWQVLLVPGAVVRHEYARESAHTLNFLNPATRYHWMSVARLFTKHPRLIAGLSPREA